MRAMFHTAMRRPVEARAAIAEARKADPKAAGTYVAEGILADRDNKVDEAKAAYTKAAELESTNAYAYFRLAQLTWQPNASKETLAAIEQHLTKAVGFNTRFADAYAWLGEVRSYLGNPDGIGLIRRAITLDPTEARYRLRAASVLMSQGKAAEARADAQAALSLAETDQERNEAQRLLDAATKAAAAPAPAVATDTGGTSNAAGCRIARGRRFVSCSRGRCDANRSGRDPDLTRSGPRSRAGSGGWPPSPPLSRAALDELNTACQSGDASACTKASPGGRSRVRAEDRAGVRLRRFPLRARARRRRQRRLGGVVLQPVVRGRRQDGVHRLRALQARGTGVIQNEAKAQATLERLCQEGVLEACTQLAVLVAPSRTPADMARARELLTKACDGKHARACEMLKSMSTAPAK